MRDDLDMSAVPEKGLNADPADSSAKQLYDEIQRQRERERVKALVDRLKEEGVHPVLIFGTNASGKTTFLQSLLFYAMGNANAKMQVAIGEQVFPSEYDDALERHKDARKFLTEGLRAFSERKLPPATQVREPFFIPIEIKISAKEGKVERYKFAFLEGMGEWYEKEHGSTYEFREFKSEISGILRQYPSGISVIFVAPVEVKKRTNARSDSHQCLANCMDEYSRLRVNRADDNLLMLLTKWDAQFNPDDLTADFCNPTSEVIMKTVQEWFVVWAKFSAMAGLRANSKALTPYAAAWINRDGEMVDAGRYRSTFEKFNRTVWNWLYGNVAASDATASGLNGRRVLYPDVTPPSPPKPGRYSSLAYFLLWLRSEVPQVIRAIDTHPVNHVLDDMARDRASGATSVLQ